MSKKTNVNRSCGKFSKIYCSLDPGKPQRRKIIDFKAETPGWEVKPLIPYPKHVTYVVFKQIPKCGANLKT